MAYPFTRNTWDALIYLYLHRTPETAETVGASIGPRVRDPEAWAAPRLRRLAGAGLARMVETDGGLWVITEQGRALVDSLN